MKKFYLERMLRESINWLNEIKQLFIDLDNGQTKYNLYFQLNREKLEELHSSISRYRQLLMDLSTSDCCFEDFNLAKTCHEDLKNEYEKIIGLSSQEFRIQRIFPCNNKDWPKQTTPQFELSIGPNKTTMAKVKLLQAGNVNALHSALVAAFEQETQPDYIDLSENKLDDISMQLLANALNGWYSNIPLSKCEVLILSTNMISSEGLRILLNALAAQPLSRHILVNNNWIDFDIKFLDYVVIPESRQAQLASLDLTLNFIPKGYMLDTTHNNNKIRLYYPTRRLETKFSAKNIDTKQRTYIKAMLFNQQNNLRCLSAKHAPTMGMISLLATQDNHNQEKEISFEFGMIGLFANKTTTHFTGEHAYIMIEGVSTFGQRYLIRGDLYTQDGKSVNIIVSQRSPQDFLKFTNKGEKILCRTRGLCRKKIKAVLDKICNSQLEQSFYNYAVYPRHKNNTQNCITWINTILKQTADIELTDGWIPSRVVGRSRRPQ